MLVKWPTLEDVEKEHIIRTLKQTNNNKTLTAALLKIGRPTLIRKIKKYKPELMVKIPSAR